MSSLLKIHFFGGCMLYDYFLSYRIVQAFKLLYICASRILNLIKKNWFPRFQVLKFWDFDIVRWEDFINPKSFQHSMFFETFRFQNFSDLQLFNIVRVFGGTGFPLESLFQERSIQCTSSQWSLMLNEMHNVGCIQSGKL